MANARQYPLLFSVRELVLCKGFVAGVEVYGRALVEQEDDGWWVFGVNPGAVAESGKSFRGAVDNFRARLRTVLFDYAEDADEFSSFKNAVERFFHASDLETETEWDAARAEVRAGRLALGDLSKDTSGRGPQIQIALLKLAPSDNLASGDDAAEQMALLAA